MNTESTNRTITDFLALFANFMSDDECEANWIGFEAGKKFKEREDWYACFQKWIRTTLTRTSPPILSNKQINEAIALERGWESSETMLFFESLLGSSGTIVGPYGTRISVKDWGLDIGLKEGDFENPCRPTFRELAVVINRGLKKDVAMAGRDYININKELLNKE